MYPFTGKFNQGPVHNSTLSQTTNFRLFKEFADGNFKFDENGRKLSKQVETLGEKEQLLVMSNFSFSSVFSKDFYCRHVKTRACLGNG